MHMTSGVSETRPEYDVEQDSARHLTRDALWDLSQGELIVVGKNATTGIFATYPSRNLTLVKGFFDQFTFSKPLLTLKQYFLCAGVSDAISQELQ
ncbi:hypothetical protein FQN60_008138 [Etheostoma spectabile]|uniref:Uncharacterized protein n=1 Tax=Etheostoma spectabile TaxID=54343 RepID=A0A5J5CU73_9PERO|nr:hypothetical protein FQN60_008138 [Etheostoma spectabile]